MQLRRSLHLEAGQTVTVEETDGGLLMRPVSRRRYSLNELLIQCDPKAPMPAELKEWDDASFTGNETW
jgi:antitoxin ChpS